MHELFSANRALSGDAVIVKVKGDKRLPLELEFLENPNVAEVPKFLHDVSLELEGITDNMLVCSTNAKFIMPNAMIRT